MNRISLAAHILFLAVASAGCASKVMKVENSEAILSTQDVDTSVQVKEMEVPAEASAATSGATSGSASGEYVKRPGVPPVAGAFPDQKTKSAKVSKAGSSPKTSAAAASSATSAGLSAPAASTARLPSIEDSEGFIGRRPAVDPFRAGEKVTLEVSYFSVVAGDMTIETRNFAEVNGKKSYRFAGVAHSTSVFAMFYAIDDWFETFVDFETLVPQSYSLHVKESKQLREVRTIFDWATKKGKYVDKKINSEKKLEEKNVEWAIPSYSQNVFSALYYLRTFTLKVGKKIQFHVGHEGKNLMLTAEVVRKETISTDAGDFDCVVVKPSISLDGHFKPMGDVFVWLTDDDRKFIVRVESKIKIGTVVGQLKSLDKGRP